jgi:hypothetical protein
MPPNDEVVTVGPDSGMPASSKRTQRTRGITILEGPADAENEYEDNQTHSEGYMEPMNEAERERRERGRTNERRERGTGKKTT